MTTIARTNSAQEALLLRSLLEGCGIAAFIPDELTAQADPPIFACSGIRVQVQDEDAAAAREVLAAPPAETT